MTQTLPGSTSHPTSQTAPNPPIPRLGTATVWDLDPQAIPATFTLDLDTDDPAALLTALQNFADHTTDPERSDAALLAAEVVRTRMTHPLTIHQILQPLLDPVGIWPVTITITPPRHRSPRAQLRHPRHLPMCRPASASAWVHPRGHRPRPARGAQRDGALLMSTPHSDHRLDTGHHPHHRRGRCGRRAAPSCRSARILETHHPDGMDRRLHHRGSRRNHRYPRHAAVPAHPHRLGRLMTNTSTTPTHRAFGQDQVVCTLPVAPATTSPPPPMTPAGGSQGPSSRTTGWTELGTWMDLAGVQMVLLDFDVPITRLLPPLINRDLSNQLKHVAIHHGVHLDADLATTSDHLALVRAAAATRRPGTLRAVEQAASRGETRAAQHAVTAPGAGKLLTWLHAHHIAVHVVTNNTPTAVEVFLERHGWTELVCDIHGRDPDHIEKMKPHPWMLHQALTHHQPHQAVMIGDSTSDMHAAHAAGIIRIGVTGTDPDHRAGQELHTAGAQILVQTLADLVPDPAQ